MKLVKIVGAGLVMAFASSVSFAADTAVKQTGVSSSLLGGIEAQALTDNTLGNIYGKHFTIELPNGDSIHPKGSKSPVISHAKLTLGGGAAVISGLPCCDSH